MKAVNLLPKDAQGGGKSFRQEDPAVVIGSALGVIVMIALVASFLVAHGKASAQQKQLTAAQLQLAQLSEKRKAEAAKLKPVKPSEPVTPIVPPPSVTGQEASWLSSVSQQLSQRISWDRLLREVSLVMPSDVTLTALNLTAPSTAVGATTTPSSGFVISGTAYSYESVARLLTRLELVPDLSDVTLGSTSSGGAAGGGSTAGVTTGGGNDVQFNITASIKGAAAPAAVPAPAPAAPPTDTSTTASGA